MKRRKRPVPIMLFWNKRDQQRFIENIERLAAQVNDIDKVLQPAKARRAAKGAAGKPYETIMTGALSEVMAAMQGLEDLVQVRGVDSPALRHCMQRLCNAKKILEGGAS